MTGNVLATYTLDGGLQVLVEDGIVYWMHLSPDKDSVTPLVLGAGTDAP